MDISRYFARKFFVKGVEWLSKYENIKSKSVNEAYFMQVAKIKKEKRFLELEKEQK